MKKLIREYAIILLGSIIFSIYVSLLLVPSKIGTGGVTGISICANYLFNFPVGLCTMILNIPLFVLGYKYIGRRFCLRSVLVIVISSAMIDYMENLKGSYKINLPIDDKILVAIFAGVLCGISMTLLFMDGASTGGFDILAKAINAKFKYINISQIILIQDFCVYILVGIVLGIKAVMYALIMSYVRSKTIDAIQEGISSSRQCIIICNNSQEIADKINAELIRGATILEAKGGYSHGDKKFAYVVIQKYQLKELKNIVKTIDPKAFITVSPVNEIYGNFYRKFSV
jgi:uncharacterized membrane-anchored protein YitT (DUF2179 family)